jgi:hypothetical protein
MPDPLTSVEEANPYRQVLQVVGRKHLVSFGAEEEIPSFRTTISPFFHNETYSSMFLVGTIPYQTPQDTTLCVDIGW